MADPFPGLTDIHAHPAMNAFLWDRDLRRHYWTGKTFDPLASLSDFKQLERGGVKVLWSSLHVPEPEFLRCKFINIAAHFTAGGRTLLKQNAWNCTLVMLAEMERRALFQRGIACSSRLRSSHAASCSESHQTASIRAIRRTIVASRGRSPRWVQYDCTRRRRLPARPM